MQELLASAPCSWSANERSNEDGNTSLDQLVPCAAESNQTVQERRGLEKRAETPLRDLLGIVHAILQPLQCAVTAWLLSPAAMEQERGQRRS